MTTREKPAPTLETIQAKSTPTAVEDEKLARVAAKIQAELGGGNSEEADFAITVYKMSRKPYGNGRELNHEFLFVATFDELDGLLLRCRDEYGAGDYRFVVTRKKERFAECRQSIALPKSLHDRPGTMPAAAAAPGLDMVAGVFERLFERLDRQDRALEALTARLTQAPPPAAVAAPLDMASMMKSTVETFVALQSLIPKPVEPSNVGIQMFEKGLELAGKIADAREGGGGGGMMELVKEVVPAITALANRAAAPAPITPAPPPLPVPMPIAARVPAPAPDPKGTHERDFQMREDPITAGVNYLCAKAAEGADPELFVDWALTSIPKEVFSVWESQPDLVGHLAEHFPQVAPHRAWFTRFVDSLYEPLEDSGPRESGRGNNEHERVGPIQ